VADKAQVDWALATIRKRESGGNYAAKNRTSTASGAYQYINGTWKGWLARVAPELVSRYPTAMSAPPELQDRVARANVESILDSNGGRLDAVPRQWYTGNPNALDSSEPNAGLTVGSYVRGWMGAYQQVSNGQDPAAEAPGAGGTPAGGASTVTAAASDTRTPEEYATEEYGYFAQYLQHPEIGQILRDAAAGKWSLNTLKGELYKTEWWKRTNESQRSWEALESSDPGEVNRRIGSQAASIMARANYLGYPISRARAEVVARDSLRNGWEGAELDRAIGMDAGQQQLVDSTFGKRLLQTSKQYALPVAPEVMGRWAQRIARGEDTEENFNTWVKDQAVNLYPSARGHIERGGTIEEFYEPYRQLAAKTLQIAPESIDLSDPKWSAALSMPDKDGNRVAMRTDEWVKMMKTVPSFGYANAQNAVVEASDLVNSLKQSWGL